MFMRWQRFLPDQRISRVVGRWKIYLTKHERIKWQRDFFDHRLRGDEALEEKARYILENPVRAGLVEKAGDWPYKTGVLLQH
jgi:putative transposase